MEKIRESDEAMRKITKLCTKLESLCKRVHNVEIGECHECSSIGINLDYMETSFGGGPERPFCK
jgi:hypothetical protein